MLTSSDRKRAEQAMPRLKFSTWVWCIVGCLGFGLLPVLGFGQELKKLIPAVKAVTVRAAVKVEVKTEEAPQKRAQKAKPALSEGPEAIRDDVGSEPEVNGAAARDKSGTADGHAANDAKQSPAEELQAEEGVVDPFEQQFKRQFGGLLKAELYFLNATCQTTTKQREKLKIAGDEVLVKVVKKFVDIQKKMNQGGFDWNSPAPDPRKQMQDELVTVVKQHLFAEQVATYESEIAKRVENRKRTTVLNVVARLDEELVLTAEQRTKLTAELSTRWKAAENQQLEIFLYGDNYFPNIPEQFVTSMLTDRQKEIWRGLGRTGNIFFGIGNFGNIVMNDAAWAEDPPIADPEL